MRPAEPVRQVSATVSSIGSHEAEPIGRWTLKAGMDQPLDRLLRSSSILALVVEDETVIRMETADLLSVAGFSVLEAWNATTALRQFERHPGIRLLVTDVQMPRGLDGLALARTVAERWPEVGIVVISGVATPAPDDLPPGARFIAKPFTPRTVLAEIEALIASGGH